MGLGAGAPEDVVADKVGRQEGDAARVQRFKDDLGVIVALKLDDDDVKAALEGAVEGH